jgi:hypothetical protein
MSGLPAEPRFSGLCASSQADDPLSVELHGLRAEG